jgi:hypothetical protein
MRLLLPPPLSHLLQTHGLECPDLPNLALNELLTCAHQQQCNSNSNNISHVSKAMSVQLLPSLTN